MIAEAMAVIGGIALLVYSADRFVEGAAATAHSLGMPPLLIGMLVIGFGTSAPEIVVSVLAAVQGNPSLALGNAYGSNIANIGLILGVTALVTPLAVQSRVLRRELPVLVGATALAWIVLRDGRFSSIDGLVQLGAFALVVGWSIVEGLRGRSDPLAADAAEAVPTLGRGRALFWLVAGLILLVVASRIVVWGAVRVATALGVSDLVVGLTVVAIGTSLPELASSLAAARKGEHDLAVGNVIGSNLFNTMLVAGLAGTIAPHSVEPALLARDLPLLAGFTLVLYLMASSLLGPGRINRLEGGLLLAGFVGYSAWLVLSATA